jgi:hypothetical protein
VDIVAPWSRHGQQDNVFIGGVKTKKQGKTIPEITIVHIPRGLAV